MQNRPDLVKGVVSSKFLREKPETKIALVADIYHDHNYCAQAQSTSCATSSNNIIANVSETQFHNPGKY